MDIEEYVHGMMMDCTYELDWERLSHSTSLSGALDRVDADLLASSLEEPRHFCIYIWGENPCGLLERAARIIHDEDGRILAGMKPDWNLSVILYMFKVVFAGRALISDSLWQRMRRRIGDSDQSWSDPLVRSWAATARHTGTGASPEVRVVAGRGKGHFTTHFEIPGEATVLARIARALDSAHMDPVEGYFAQRSGRYHAMFSVEARDERFSRADSREVCRVLADLVLNEGV
ncbi:MAG: hypothetical protein ACLFOY_03075 [Desulfatibacillaceae bacterium]